MYQIATVSHELSLMLNDKNMELQAVFRALAAWSYVVSFIVKFSYVWDVFPFLFRGCTASLKNVLQGSAKIHHPYLNIDLPKSLFTV